jgi:hypothetical protein
MSGITTSSSQAPAPIKRPQPPVQSAPAAMPSPVQGDTMKSSALPAVGPISIPKFKSLDAYKQFVAGSKIDQIPAYQQQVSELLGVLSRAMTALSQKKDAVNYGTLENALKGSEANLDKVQHPGRERADAARAKAQEYNQEIDGLTKQIGDLQAQINNARLNQDVNVGIGMQSQTLTGAVLSGIGAALDQSAMNKMTKQIADLNAQVVRAQVNMTTQETLAVQMDAIPPDPTALKAATDAVQQAQDRFNLAAQQVAPESQAVARAQGNLDQAQASVANLQNARNSLKDYGQCFDALTQVKLTWSDHGWKKQLDDFWKGK